MSMQQAVDVAHGGYRVAIIGKRARHLIGEAEHSTSDISGVSVTRTQGRSRIAFPGGGRIDFYQDADCARGTTIDAAYLTDIGLAIDGATLETLAPCFLGRHQRIGVLI